MTSDIQSSPFIKHLASSDKRTRDHALDSLRTFLSGRSQIEELDLLKLWKGLFYCMWMQDKPLNQQRLARDLASLVEALQKDVVLPFLDAFWKTMAREWNGIGALRMDKFLYLIRQYLHASFRYLSHNTWSDTTAVDHYISIIETTPLNAKDMKIPNGLRYHVLDIYVDELEKVAGEKVEEMPLERLLEPLRKLEKESKTKAVREAARNALRDERVRRWMGEESEKGESEDEEMEEGSGDEWGGIED
ncbi:hypothetical protein GQ43DRAFT_397563 [Delitschia confertaspora ATCC 74209]|uniref:Uncharacterized protein n=1 Tax=Delitschia confertaspora ATCC 74209 TaxID=1513339 RepID=A0A9P4JKN8_9PLEO|nr:hypothetical protein GQ43DRAFT_397563 [Delitschia confertaspora ATCC 74209]